MPALVRSEANEAFNFDVIGNRISDAQGSLTYDPTGQLPHEDFADKGASMIDHTLHSMAKSVGSVFDMPQLLSTTHFTGWSAASILLTSISTANFIGNQISNACVSGESWDWKTQQCKPDEISIPVPPIPDSWH